MATQSIDVFISYAQANKARVQPIAQLLQTQGWSVWWDPEVPVGQQYDQVIQEALKSAKCVIVVWSVESVESIWVRSEANVGSSRKVLAPVMIDKVDPPLAFSLLQAANLVGWDGQARMRELEKLLKAVERHAGRPRIATKPPTPEEPSPLPASPLTPVPSEEHPAPKVLVERAPPKPELHGGSVDQPAPPMASGVSAVRPAPPAAPSPLPY